MADPLKEPRTRDMSLEGSGQKPQPPQAPGKGLAPETPQQSSAQGLDSSNRF